jgi:hypothetical protein
MGHPCFYFAGEAECREEVAKICDEAHFDHPEVQSIQRDVFGKSTRERVTSDQVHRIKECIKSSLYEFRDRFDLDLLIPENALAIPMNIPLGLALTEFIAETGIDTIAHHHDFAWERERYLINACRDYLHAAFPPDLPSIYHVVINTLAAQQLSFRRGLSSTVIPNVLDFAREPTPPDGYCKGLRSQVGLGDDDLFVLQPTRVVARKWIERSIEIVHNLDLRKPILVISHASGDEGDDYNRRIREYAQNLGVDIRAIDRLIAPERGINEKGEKLYTITDVYRSADLITYPSGYEGFGNAFLEAVYLKKPIIVNRYSIFITDIEPLGFDVILMDGFVSSHAIEQVREILTDGNRLETMVERNYELARQYFSYEVLEECLRHILKIHSAGGCAVDDRRDK